MTVVGTTPKNGNRYTCLKSSTNFFPIFVNRIAAEGCTVSTYRTPSILGACAATLPINNDCFRLDGFQLRCQVGFTGFDFVWQRFPISGRDVFDDVGDEDVSAVDAVFRENFVEEFSRSAHERLARFVFLFAWVLSNKHYAGVVWSFARNSVFGSLPKPAFSATVNLQVQFVKVHTFALVVVY